MQTAPPEGWNINFQMFIHEHFVCCSWSVHCQ